MNIQVEVDIENVETDAIYENLRNSNEVSSDILNIGELSTTEWTCSICKNKFKASASLDCPNDASTKTQEMCDKCDKIHSSLLQLHGLATDDHQNGANEHQNGANEHQNGANEHQNGANANRQTTAVTEYTCTKCGKIYKTKRTLRAHDLLIHPEDEVIGHCLPCYKSYPSVLSLNRHKRYMHQSYPCKVCYKRFLTEDSLITHGRLCVNADTPCSICKKIYNSDLALRNHIKYKHPQNVNHRCVYCRRFFTNDRRLSNHIATVHPPGEMTCYYCYRAFSSTNALKRHVLYKHTDGTARCEFCRRVYANMTLLFKHMSKNHF